MCRSAGDRPCRTGLPSRHLTSAPQQPASRAGPPASPQPRGSSAEHNRVTDSQEADMMRLVPNGQYISPLLLRSSHATIWLRLHNRNATGPSEERHAHPIPPATEPNGQLAVLTNLRASPAAHQICLHGSLGFLTSCCLFRLRALPAHPQSFAGRVSNATSQGIHTINSSLPLPFPCSEHLELQEPRHDLLLKRQLLLVVRLSLSLALATPLAPPRLSPVNRRVRRQRLGPQRDWHAGRRSQYCLRCWVVFLHWVWCRLVCGEWRGMW